MPVSEPGGWSDGLLEAGLGSPDAAGLLGWPTRVARMLEVEVALARVQARHGIISDDKATAIAAAADPAQLDLGSLAEAAAGAASPVIALLDQLRVQVPPEVSAVIHHGATSQDIIDSAVMLQVRDALGLLESQLIVLADRCAELADAHRATVMAGRTLKQQAVPITFGLLAARWLGMLDRRLTSLRQGRPRILALQFGGAAGTLGVFADVGPALAQELADDLGLPAPDLPWHAERDRIVELAGLLAAVGTVTSKIAKDVVELSATEVGEVITVPRGGPGSSAMPHKGRNPVDAMAARAAARLAGGEIATLLAAAGEHEHERAAGAWQAEWVALPSALVRTIGAVERLRAAVAVLEVDPDRGRRNLDANLGLAASEALATALAATLGRPAAQALTAEVVEVAVRQGRSLVDAAADDGRVLEVLAAHEVAAVCDPTRSLTNVDALIEAALATHRTVLSEGGPAVPGTGEDGGAG